MKQYFLFAENTTDNNESKDNKEESISKDKEENAVPNNNKESKEENNTESKEESITEKNNKENNKKEFQTRMQLIKEDIRKRKLTNDSPMMSSDGHLRATVGIIQII